MLMHSQHVESTTRRRNGFVSAPQHNYVPTRMLVRVGMVSMSNQWSLHVDIYAVNACSMNVSLCRERRKEGGREVERRQRKAQGGSEKGKQGN